MPKYFNLKISLKDINPPIWRTVLVDPGLTFEMLHEVILDTMGWTGSHMYEFKVGKRSFGYPDDELPEIEDGAKTVFSSLFREKGDKITYIYDFGDYWVHEIEHLGDKEMKDEFLARCTGGERACPPEDCGSVSGYQEIVESMKHPNSKEYKENVEWLCGPYNPENFNLKETNEILEVLEDEINDKDFDDEFDDFDEPMENQIKNMRTLMERNSRAIGKMMSQAKTKKESDALLKKMKNMEIPQWQPENKEEEAQELCYQAMESDNPVKIRNLINEALKLDPDCTEAYNLLAELSESLPDAHANYSKAVKAGEKSLGEEFFKEETGRFWQLVETRPYMRALAGKMETASRLNKHEEAIAICRKMLDLNPNDNQGIRTTFAALLLKTKKTDELDTLVNKTFKKEKMTTVFTRFALSYLKEQDSAATQKLFKEAKKENKFLFDYFVTMPEFDHLPGSYAMGSPEEAYGYYYDMWEAWLSVPNLIPYIAKMTGIESPIKGTWQVVSSKSDKVGRNEPCPCGSGKKYKHCCGT